MGSLQRKAEQQEKEMGEGRRGGREREREKRKRNSTLLWFWWQCQLTTMRSSQNSFLVTTYLLPCFTQLFKASFGEKLCFQGNYPLELEVQHLLVLPSQSQNHSTDLWMSSWASPHSKSGQLLCCIMSLRAMFSQVFNVSKEEPKRDWDCASVI